MAESTLSTLHIPIRIMDQKNQAGVPPGAHLFCPADPAKWLERLRKDAESSGNMFLTISSETDDPDTFYITFSPCPGGEALQGLEEGTHFGIETSIGVIRALRDALSFLVAEHERGQ